MKRIGEPQRWVCKAKNDQPEDIVIVLYLSTCLYSYFLFFLVRYNKQACIDVSFNRERVIVVRDFII